MDRSGSYQPPLGSFKSKFIGYGLTAFTDQQYLGIRLEEPPFHRPLRLLGRLGFLRLGPYRHRYRQCCLRSPTELAQLF